jgi:hypothetical protein
MDYDNWKTTNPDDELEDCTVCGAPCGSLTINDCPVCESCYDECDPRNEYNPDDIFDE